MIDAIPDDVMKAAREADAAVHRGEGGVFEVTARAIMAERERCMDIALDANKFWSKEAAQRLDVAARAEAYRCSAVAKDIARDIRVSDRPSQETHLEAETVGPQWQR